MKMLPKEICGACKKYIYIHDKILVCTNENQAYHAKCLKIENDVADEIQQLTDWYCPRCLKSIIPFFNEPIKAPETSIKNAAHVVK